jgi:hypothetical protein
MRSTFAPPEIETEYGKEGSQAFAFGFLRSLIQEARRFGIEVTLSVESFTPKVYSRFSEEFDVNRELLANTGKALVQQVLDLYPEINRMEIISREWTQVEVDGVESEIDRKLGEMVDEDTAREILALLEDGLQETPEFLYLDKEAQRKMFLDALYSLQNSLDIFNAVAGDEQVAPTLKLRRRVLWRPCWG